MCFLPLSHVFERMLDYAYLYRGATIAYAESIEKLKDNFLEVNPHCFGAVPRVYEKVLARIMSKVESGSSLKKQLFHWAVATGKERLSYEQKAAPVPAGLAFAAKVADKLVLGKIRHALGKRFRYAVSGGAPLSPELAEFFWGAGVTIYEGYGLTETSPVICVNGPHAWRLGTVGRPIPGVEVRIAEDGEILTRGPHVMKGYFNKPEATAEAIDPEGWFHTGDIGQFDSDGYLKITDRKKDLIVLASGKKAAPQPIETELKKSAYVSLPIVLGDRHKFLAALIVPNFERLKEEAAQKGISLRARDDRREPGDPRPLPEGDRRVQRGQAPPRADPRFRPAAGGLVGRGRDDHADAQGQAADPGDPVPGPDREDVPGRGKAACRVMSSSWTACGRRTRRRTPS